MSDGNFSVFDFAPKVVDKKSRYRDEDPKKKFTYNFVTDPKMKRGHNFGVVYVTNTSIDEEAMGGSRKKESIVKATDTTIDKKKKTLEIDVPRPPKGRENLGVNTSPVASTIRPKALTFEMGVQIDLYIDRPQTPLFWPQKTGIDRETQIEDGDLFYFDEEVQPILNVLLSKVLEQSRMEVLEEEEIKEMKLKQREFEELRNRELTEVQKLEDKEARELAEKNRRISQKKIEKEIQITYQKKLFTRQFAKEYLSKLKDNTLRALEERGVLRNPIANQFQNNLLKHIFNNAESIKNSDYQIINNLNKAFEDHFSNNKKSSHRQALEDRKQKLEEIKQMNLQELEKKKQEKLERRAEAGRKKKEKELAILKKAIEEEFISKVEIVDNPENVYNINGNTQKKKYAPAIGGLFAQFTIIMAHFSILNNDFLNEDKLSKVLEIYIPKCPMFNIIYKNEDLDHYKTLDANGGIINMEDIIKLEDHLYNDIFKQITKNNLDNDALLNTILDLLSQSKGFENIKDNYLLIMACLMKLLKSGESSITERIKFLVKDSSIVDDNNYMAITEIYPISISNPKPVDQNIAQNAKRVSTISKKPAGNRPVHEPFFTEKTVIIPTMNEKNKILAVNYPFEKMLRSNILDCMNKIIKIDGEIETVKEQFEEFYMLSVADPVMKMLKETFKQEIIIFEDVKPKDS